MHGVMARLSDTQLQDIELMAVPIKGMSIKSGIIMNHLGNDHSRNNARLKVPLDVTMMTAVFITC
jgi:hypothetical protein